ncbi:hypothetical protein IJ670_02980 [bacterium]|nr:hypothetical protein [bacterium]
MNIDEYEHVLVSTINNVIVNIIKENLEPNITAMGRVGAQISDYLEENFYKIVSSGKIKELCNPEKAPKNKTKNPWDARCSFVIKDIIKDDIWIDFKAIQITRLNSNPDIGTPNKIIDFIKNGKFYLLYVYVFYEAKNNEVHFISNNGDYVKSYLLKDINHTFRRNPKNQLQVNASAKPEVRSRADFIKLLCLKLKESNERQIEISKKTLAQLDEIEKDLLYANDLSEQKLINLIENI